MLSKKIKKHPIFRVCAVGFAMFAMFFGAGNIMFPIALGLESGTNAFWACLGLFLSGVLMPFFGIIVMGFFDGDYRLFFGRLGRKLGLFIAFALMMILGPLSGTPRCITLAATTIQHSFPIVSPVVFISFACIFLYILAIKKHLIIDVLGFILTPVLLIALIFLIVKGMISAPALDSLPDYTSGVAFVEGVKKGYYAIDLIAAIFFAILIIPSLEEVSGARFKDNPRGVLWVSLLSSLIGMTLLTFVYSGFMYLSARHGQTLVNIEYNNLLGIMSSHIFGKSGGVMTNIIVSLACLTTALAQLVVFSNFLHRDVSKGKISYTAALFITLIVAFAISNLGFWGVINLIAPVLVVCYPSLILLCILNLLYKCCDFRLVKLPVFILFVISLIFAFL